MGPGWWLKFDRGQEHLNILTQFVTDAFANEDNLPILAAKFDTDTDEHVLYVKKAPDLSDLCSRVGVILGDCLNNFRNALDYLVYEMGLRNTVDTGGLRYRTLIKFPIVSKKEAWPAILGKELSDISPNHQMAIERFQPYHEGNLQTDLPSGQAPYHPLVMLRELTDADKHRLLTPIVVPHGNAIVMGEIALAMMHSGRCRVMHANHDYGLPVECGSEVWRAKLSADMPRDEVERAGRIEALAVVIQPHKYRIERLINTIAQSVKKIISDLESTL